MTSAVDATPATNNTLEALNKIEAEFESCRKGINKIDESTYGKANECFAQLNRSLGRVIKDCEFNKSDPEALMKSFVLYTKIDSYMDGLAVGAAFGTVQERVKFISRLNDLIKDALKPASGDTVTAVQSPSIFQRLFTWK